MADGRRKPAIQLLGKRLGHAGFAGGIRPGYYFDVSCQGSVPESIIAFLESTDFESAVRNAVSLGGDTDTMGCIAGGIAQAYYGTIPQRIEREVRARLPEDLLEVVDAFEERFGRGRGGSSRAEEGG